MTEEPRPILLIVEDDRETRHRVEQNLRRRYTDQYQVTTAASDREALGLFSQYQEREVPVALLIVGCSVSGKPGARVIERARKLFPEVRRIMLAGPDEKENLVEALNRQELDNYLLTPLSAPEDDLYPVIDDLLEEWNKDEASTQEEICIVGYRWSPRAHQMKTFLSRNLIPYRWYEVEESPEASQMVTDAQVEDRRLPVAFFPDGSYLVQPSVEELAEKVGFQKRAESPFYNLIVVGGGPAGLSAAVYGASEGLQTLLIEAEAPGGQAGQSSKIENYLGFPAGLSGNELTRRAVAQAQRFGVEILTPQRATGIRLLDRYRLVQLEDGSRVACDAVLISTGVSYRRLEVPGEERLTGAGVYYGTVITEALACSGQEVFILGGGNSAGQAAMYLSRFASRITILTDRNSLKESMSQYLVDQIEEADNIQTCFRSTVVELHGESHLEAITVEDLKTKQRQTINAVAIFIYIGAYPHTGWLGDLVACNEQGYILTGPDVVNSGKNELYKLLGRDPLFMESSVPGIFAAGDTRMGSVKRIASSVGEGAMAVTLIHQYLAH